MGSAQGQSPGPQLNRRGKWAGGPSLRGPNHEVWFGPGFPAQTTWGRAMRTETCPFTHPPGPGDHKYPRPERKGPGGRAIRGSPVERPGQRNQNRVQSAPDREEKNFGVSRFHG